MKKTIAGILLLCMLLTSLVACGGGNENNSEPSGEDNKEENQNGGTSSDDGEETPPEDGSTEDTTPPEDGSKDDTDGSEDGKTPPDVSYEDVTPVTLNIGSYNIANGREVDHNMMKLAKDLAGKKLDIVGLQEVDQFCNRSGYGSLILVANLAKPCGSDSVRILLQRQQALCVGRFQPILGQFRPFDLHNALVDTGNGSGELFKSVNHIAPPIVVSSTFV